MMNMGTHFVVRKPISLVRTSAFELGCNEQKMIIWLLYGSNTSGMKENGWWDKKEFLKILGINSVGENSIHVSNTAMNLRGKKFSIRHFPHADDIIPWVHSVKFSGANIQIKMDRRTERLWLETTGGCIEYDYSVVAGMRSKYSIRMYELLKSYEGLGECCLSLEKFKDWLQCPEYSVYDNFRRRVIDSAIEEINELSDMEIAFTPERIGRKIQNLRFRMKSKQPI